MSTSYTHFTTNEREMLLVFQKDCLSLRAMARKLGRSVSSVSRELQRNANSDGSYSAFAAEEAYRKRKTHCGRKRKLSEPTLKDYVTEKLLHFWSPEQIDGRLKWEKSSLQISYATIYRALHDGMLNVPKNCLRRKGRDPSPYSSEKRGRIHGYKTIHQRPKAADKRTQFGHWEGDTVRGAQAKGAVATYVDRRSGYLVGALMPNRKADTLTECTIKAFESFPASLKRSFTVDHGNEFFSYAKIEDALKTQVYFADPYSSWQRGLNENTNGLLRQYFPKKCDFLRVSAEDFRKVIDALNHRPRKRLGFRSPAEVFPCKKMLRLY